MKNKHGGARPGAGRPKGSLNNKAFRKQLENRGEELIQLIIEKALSGDKLFLKLCFERLIPMSKAVTVPSDTDIESLPLVINVS